MPHTYEYHTLAQCLSLSRKTSIRTKHMKTTLLSAMLSATVLTITLLSPHSIRAAVHTDTRHATIFLRGAELEQTARLSLNKGANEVRIEGLAPDIDPAGIRVTLTNGALVSAFEYTTDYLSAHDNNDAQRLRDSLDLYNTRLATIRNEIETDERLLQLLQTGVTNALNNEKQPLSGQLIEQQLTYYQRRSLTISEQRATHEKQRDRLNERIEALQKQLQQLTSRNATRSGVLTLTIMAPKAGTATANLRYFTTQAGWSPIYDINIPDISSPAGLTLHAQVCQQTGLDWNNVTLTLSTGVPASHSRLPETDTWFLRRQQPARFYAKSRNAVATAALFMANETPELAEVEEDSNTYGSMEDLILTDQQALAVTYDIQLPYSILGNGKAQTIQLTQQEIQTPIYKYYTIPKLDSRVFLGMELTNPEQYSMLNAPARITYAGTYYGQTPLNGNNTDEQLRLSIGDEPQIAVKRELLAQLSRTKNIGSNRSDTRTYRITLRNNKKQPATIRLQEPYPVSTAKEISVALDNTTTRWSENDTEHGLLTYDLTLQPGESSSVLVSYTVKYPKDWNINL